MRMWKVDPRKMCRKHLLGEHVEMHMAVGSINKGIAIHPDMAEVHHIQTRHDQLAEEMVRRGYKHKSPLPKFEVYKWGKVDSHANWNELKNRCEECRQNATTTN